MFISMLLSGCALSLLCLLLVRAAIYALPIFVGLNVAFWAFGAGIGLLSAVIGVIAASFLFVAGQVAVTDARPPWLRLGNAALFVVPATYAGYSLVIQIAHLGAAAGVWTRAVAIIGGIAIVASALTQLDSLRHGRPAIAPSRHHDPDRPPLRQSRPDLA